MKWARKGFRWLLCTEGPGLASNKEKLVKGTDRVHGAYIILDPKPDSGLTLPEVPCPRLPVVGFASSGSPGPCSSHLEAGAGLFDHKSPGAHKGDPMPFCQDAGVSQA